MKSTGLVRLLRDRPRWPGLVSAFPLVLALSACAGPGGLDGAGAPASRSDGPDAFRAEVRAGRSPGCPLRGEAVHLGAGRFLTAAHLVDDVVPGLRRCTGTPIPVTVRYGGRTLLARPLRLGEGYVEPGIGPLYRGGQDLALLQSGVVLPGPGARPCGEGPEQGQPVVVLASGRQAAVTAGPVMPEVRVDDGAYADLPLSMAEGDSGAGVFDAVTGCLLGIVSHRPDSAPGHVRIVPAAAIRAFLDG